MKTSNIIFFLVLGFVSLNCSSDIPADSILVEKPSPTPQIFKSEAKLSLQMNEAITSKETIFNNKENYSKVYFVDMNSGFLIGNLEKDGDFIGSNLYKTDNSGKSWEKVSIEPEKKATFGTICFANPLVGWVSIQRVGNVNRNDTKFWLMKTIDGGRSWQNILSQELTEIENVVFIDEKNGWLIGSTSNPENIYDSKQFLRFTDDGGVTWSEIGKSLFEQNGFEERDARQNITGIIAETTKDLKVVMRSGKLFETKDGGKTWQQFGPQFDFPEQTIPDNFGRMGNSTRLRMGRGTWSIEGVYSYFATEKNGDWTIRWMDKPLCVYDILFLNEKEMLAVGRYEVNDKEDGVILYSSDASENWNLIYRNKKISVINSISQISEKQFVAVGNHGLIVNISLN